MAKEKQRQNFGADPFSGSGFDTDESSEQVNVIHGVYSHTAPLAGKSVGTARLLMKARLNIDDQSVTVVNGRQADEDYVLSQGETLIFVAPAGEKGTESHDMVLDSKLPMELRLSALFALTGISGDDERIRHCSHLLEMISKKSSQAATNDELKAKEVYQNLVHELTKGPIIPAVACDKIETNAVTRLRVIASNGDERLPIIPENLQGKEVVAGQQVYVDNKGMLLLGIMQQIGLIDGSAATLLQIIDDHWAEIRTTEDQRRLYRCSQGLIDAVKNGVVHVGDRILVRDSQRFAFAKMPDSKDRSYRFLDSNFMPQVSEKDIGNLHECYHWLVDRTKVMLEKPELLAKYDFRPRTSLLMVGGPGTGKTYTIKAFLNKFSGMVDERLGYHHNKSRVIRLKASELLSQWLGVSDKNIDRLFDDIVALGREPIPDADGTLVNVPIIVIFEEADGLGAHRSHMGEDGAGGAQDRILTTFLQRLDDPVDEIADIGIVFISTTNKVQRIDAGMFRRLGAKIAKFNRLDKAGFVDILSRKLKPKYPINGKRSTKSDRAAFVEQVAMRFYDKNDEAVLQAVQQDQVVTYLYRHNFMTPAMIEQAIAAGIDEVIFAISRNDVKQSILRPDMIVDSLNRQIDNLVTMANAFNLPDLVELNSNALVKSIEAI